MLIVISRREVLKTLYRIMFPVAEVDSRTILYHFKEINWIGTHWRGTQRRSPVEGVNSIINFCLRLSVSVFSSLYLFISVVFHFRSEHLIYVNVVPLINLLIAFFYNKLLMHSS